MEGPRFIAYTGEVQSRNDGQYHWITTNMLIRLYKLTREEINSGVATLAGNEKYCRAKAAKDKSGKIHLFPNKDGNYSRFWETQEIKTDELPR